MSQSEDELNEGVKKSKDEPSDALDRGHRAEAEPEHKGSIWTHPYVLYIWVTLALFLLLLLMAYIGYKAGVVPNVD